MYNLYFENVFGNHIKYIHYIRSFLSSNEDIFIMKISILLMLCFGFVKSVIFLFEQRAILFLR